MQKSARCDIEEGEQVGDKSGGGAPEGQELDMAGSWMKTRMT